MKPPFPVLLSPLRVGRHRLRNRLIMGSMHTRLEHLDRPIERQVAFYGAREARALDAARAIEEGTRVALRL